MIKWTNKFILHIYQVPSPKLITNLHRTSKVNSYFLTILKVYVKLWYWKAVLFAVCTQKVVFNKMSEFIKSDQIFYESYFSLLKQWCTSIHSTPPSLSWGSVKNTLQKNASRASAIFYSLVKKLVRKEFYP